MTTTINASTSSGLVVTPDNSGNVLLQYNGVAAPAFSAYATGNQSFANGTFAKVTLNAEEFDTASCFDSTTNYRFTPTVAGYYQLTVQLSMSGSNTGVVLASIYKNGSEFKRVGQCANKSDNVIASGTALVYANGTDYFEFYCLQNSGGTLGSNGGSTSTLFSGCLLRGA